MALPTSTPSLDDIPEDLHEHYKAAEGGGFELVITGAPSGYVSNETHSQALGKVEEFRRTTEGLQKGIAEMAGVDQAADLEPLKAHLAKFEGIDPEEYKTLKTKAEELGKKGVTKTEDLDNLVSAKVQEILKPTLADLEQEKSRRLEAEARADASLFSTAVGDIFSQAKGRSRARALIELEAGKAFEVVNGEVTAKAGHVSKEQATLGEPLTLNEWMAGAITTFDFAFEGSGGGGADPITDGGPGDRGTSSGVKELRNPTNEQLGDPVIAKQIREKKLRVVND